MSVGVLPLLLSLVFPACGKAGADGVKPPGVVDFTALTLPSSPNKALVAPVGFTPKPTLTTPHYPVPPAALFAIVNAVAASQPRVFVLDDHPTAMQRAWVARTPTANFPDVIEMAVRADPSGGSDLILYSRSLYGYSDFGVNEARLKTWLGEIGAKVASVQS